jgi:hypothetical protein
LTSGSKPENLLEMVNGYKGKMTWKIYNMIMSRYNQKDFRSVRLRIGILLLAVTRAKISEILMLKVGCLRVLEK